MKTNFSIGDKVICHDSGGIRRIGTVVNITQKRHDIVVVFGNYKETYRADGYSKGGSVWYHSYIELLTPERQEDIRKTNLVLKCRKTFDAKRKDLTADQAEKILEILSEEDMTK
jgi:hypothetical protein